MLEKVVKPQIAIHLGGIPKHRNFLCDQLNLDEDQDEGVV